MAPTGKVAGQDTTEIEKLYRDIDLLDGRDDHAYISIPIYQYGIFDTCSFAESTAAGFKQMNPAASHRVKFHIRAKLSDGRTVNVSCADHIKNLRPIVEAIKKVTWYANAAIAEKMDPMQPYSLEAHRRALQKMSDQDRQLYQTANILDEVLVAYVQGQEDSMSPSAQAVDNGIGRLIANRTGDQPAPESWLANGNFDKTKVFHGMMDVFFTLGVDPVGIIPEPHRTGYHPKKLETILRQRQLRTPTIPI